MTCGHRAALSLKRFYRYVDVAQNDKKQYLVSLDGRRIKTPLGNLFTVASEPLALAVMQEWDSQMFRVDMNRMHLTSLCITAIDNVANQTTDNIVDEILKFFDNDTLFFMCLRPEGLSELQKWRWGTMIDWAKVIINVHADYDTIMRYFSAYGFDALIGCSYAAEVLKSVLLLLALMEGRITVEEAVDLTTLEQQFQMKTWGRVEWAHDVEFHEMCSRLGAAMTFIYFSTNSQSTSKVSTDTKLE
ncbi:unnamed protein product [Soboliphyme baturini]|uniref:ATP synthase mitochondrial F1 complex assembly factor 2 n=1 Tax=Soboliphyme baturini TaxID=241478 RepID=A0A183INU0_9BILA|nr:unnamed protein product [Soboliphyme baturini]